MIQDIILQIKLNALKLDERLNIEELEERILKLEKSIELLNDQLDRINDHDRPPLNSGILSTLTNSRNNYKYYLEKLEA